MHPLLSHLHTPTCVSISIYICDYMYIYDIYIQTRVHINIRTMLQYMRENDYLHQFPTSSSPRETKLSYGQELAPACPRCASSNTKFCYYNNYSLSQPRYYCKGCRRYWTKGGSLRNIPAGGGCRKRSRRRLNSSRRFGRNENQLDERRNGLDHQDEESEASPCPEIDLAAVFANYVNHQSPSSTDNTTRSDQESPATTTSTDVLDWGMDLGFFGQFDPTQKIEDQEEMFKFQSLLNDKEIQEILNCSFSQEPEQLNSPASFMINDDYWINSSDLSGFGI